MVGISLVDWGSAGVLAPITTMALVVTPVSGVYKPTIDTSSYRYLVGGFGHFSFFHILGIIIPTDFHIFQRGRSTTNQINPSNYRYIFAIKFITLVTIDDPSKYRYI